MSCLLYLKWEEFERILESFSVLHWIHWLVSSRHPPLTRINSSASNLPVGICSSQVSQIAPTLSCQLKIVLIEVKRSTASVFPEASTRLLGCYTGSYMPYFGTRSITENYRGNNPASPRRAISKATVITSVHSLQSQSYARLTIPVIF